QLPLDENGIEQVGNLEARNLLALSHCRAVGEQRQPTAGRAKPSHGFNRVRQGFHPDVTVVTVSVADACGEIGVLDPKLEQGKPHDLAARGVELKTPFTMPIGIIPEPFRRLANGIDNHRGIERGETRGVRCARGAPALVYARAVVKDRVVQVEKQGGWCHLSPDLKWYLSRLPIDGDAKRVLTRLQRRLVPAREG